jgi:hypothetical protein
VFHREPIRRAGALLAGSSLGAQGPPPRRLNQGGDLWESLDRDERPGFLVPDLPPDGVVTILVK